MGMLVVKDWGVFQDKKRNKGAKHRQSPRGKPGSECYPPDTRSYPVSCVNLSMPSLILSFSLFSEDLSPRTMPEDYLAR